MRVVTAMLTGFFVIAGGAIPTPLASVHPPGLDVTKPAKPHYVLLRRKPEPSLVRLNPAFFWDHSKKWELRPRSDPSVYPPWSKWSDSSVYPPWSKWVLPAGNKRITLTAEEQRR